MLWGSSALSEFRTSLSKVLTLWHCVKVKQCYHSITCFLTCIVAMIILPETQGKTLTELSQLYSEKSEQPGKKMVIPKIVITDCNGIQKSKYLSNFTF